MKKYQIITMCMAAAGMLASCSDDLATQPDNRPAAQPGQPLRIGASLADEASSRMTITENTTEVALAWSAGDALQVFHADQAEPTLFSLVGEGGSAAGEFEGTPESGYAEGDKLYALYNKDFTTANLDEDGNVTLSVKDQDGRLTDKYQYMLGEATYKEGESPVFKLRHLVTLVKVNIRTEVALKSITFNSSELYSDVTLVLKKRPSDLTGDLPIEMGDQVFSKRKETEGVYGEGASEAPITITGPFEPVNNVVTVYFYVLPAKQYSDWGWGDGCNVYPSFTAIDTNDVTYMSTVNLYRKSMEKGKMYELTTGLYPTVDFENEATADGTETRPYEIATAGQLYSLMLRAKGDQQNEDGRKYRDCCYKLVNDIVLDDAIEWTSIENFFATFDGDGHTISGKMTSNGGLFGSTNGGHTVFKNLTLDLDIDTDNSGGSFGTLCNYAYSSTITNCVNRSNITTYSNRIGGLVGHLYINSTMTACVNTGNFNAGDNAEYMGGIAAYVESNSSIIACYNTGTLTAANERAVCGGIAGNITDSSLTGCWTAFGEVVGNLDNATVTDCYTATGIPTLEEIAAMNNAIRTTGLMYKEDGTLAPNDKSVVPSIPSEEW